MARVGDIGVTEEYSQRNFLRLVKRIPVIIKNFQCGVSVQLLASQNQCNEAVIEEIIRLAFKAKFEDVETEEE